MTSPKEPGHSRASEGPGSANGAAGTPGAVPEGEVPPWQRGPAARASAGRPADGTAAGRPAEGANAPRPAEGGNRPAHPQGVDARLNRFISGGNAPARETPANPPQNQPRETEVLPTRTERPEAARPENYASELPDLSGPPPRPARPAAAESRPAPPPGRVQVANRKQGPVRASMQIRRIDPWSTLKVSLVLSAALFFVWMIAVAFLYLVLGGMGVWSKLNSNVGDLLTSNSGTGGELVSSGTIFGGAALIGLVNIVLLTAMATAGAFIYNLTTDLVGGVEVTLADRD
ncbi:transmembrane domain of unknown function [Mycolicibacterium canariasense]|uniref:DUF3566 domain-containing protein n=1 Tax=Mycolicibacterium canariasense TaxID=228230 RepID=A0A117IAM6_MYCCR|nr:DUF3566 domain-containing protein [Mycolicibacterium canariasense]MCV7211133.1 DUF3566 domain-containing protein [Mycolicibacterium canariasense]ORV07966.1 hypothetical protein AWB94_13290 [Mycolicibacterium canariasense]GAS96575.1 transmembrane domain of unknown function [Mycolicibacterium canariasense]